MLGWMKVCWIELGQVGLGWDGLGCNIALRWGTVLGSFQLLKIAATQSNYLSLGC